MVTMQPILVVVASVCYTIGYKQLVIEIRWCVPITDTESSRRVSFLIIPHCPLIDVKYLPAPNLLPPFYNWLICKWYHFGQILAYHEKCTFTLEHVASMCLCALHVRVLLRAMVYGLYHLLQWLSFNSVIQCAVQRKFSITIFHTKKS